MDYRQKQGEFWKIQEISFQMSPRTSTFWEKMAETKKVKVAYPSRKLTLFLEHHAFSS